MCAVVYDHVPSPTGTRLEGRHCSMTTDPFGSRGGSQACKRGEKMYFHVLFGMYSGKHFHKNLKTKYCEQTDKGNVNMYLLLWKSIHCIQFPGEMK